MAEDFTKEQLTTTTTQHKIFAKDTISVNGTRTITHNLGYIPFIRVWAQQVVGEWNPIVVIGAATNYHSRYLSSAEVLPYVTSTTLVILNTIGGPVNVHYRIYYDS